MTAARVADTPTSEPYDVLLTPEQRASIDVRGAASQAAWVGVPLELAIAEVRFAYRLIGLSRRKP